jgi:hypothetical protein
MEESEAMEESELRSRILQRVGLRIGPGMSKYTLRKLAEPDRPVKVIGGDARTGVARTEVIDPRVLLK